MYRYVLSTLFLLVSIAGYSQFENDNPSLQMQTPDVASFTKFIDHPVSHINGSADVSLPVYTISDGNADIPITLRYNTSGIKVTEEASWVGLGWNLNVGGIITQDVIGEYDGFGKSASTIQNQLLTFIPGMSEVYQFYGQGGTTTIEFCSDPSIPTSLHNTYCTQCIDTYVSNGKGQPDIYSFSFMGYSGKFYIDETDGSIHIIDKKEDILFDTYQDGNLQWHWKATVPDGTVLFFEEEGTSTIGVGGANKTNAYNYYLTKVVLSNGQSITYSYTNHGINQRVFLTQSIITEISGPCPVTESYNLKESPYQETYDVISLNEINTDNIKIKFFTSSRTDDLLDEVKLDSIQVLDKTSNETKKVYEFTYDYFTSAPDPNVWNGGLPTTGADKRLRLLSFGEINDPKYLFDYSSVQIPNKRTCAVDYWGYYNGATQNTNLIPEIKHLTFPLSPTNELPSVGLTHADRSANPDFTEAGSLIKITYPTGGSMNLNYEANSWVDGTWIATTPERLEYLSYNQQFITEASLLANGCIDQTTGYFFDLTEPTRVRIDFTINWGDGDYDDVKDAFGRVATRDVVYNTPIATVLDQYNQPALYKPHWDDINDDTPLINLSENYFDVILPAGNYGVYVGIPAILGCTSESSGLKITSGAEIEIVPESVFPPGMGQESYGAGIRVATVEQRDSDASTLVKTKFKYQNGKRIVPLLFNYDINNLQWPCEYECGFQQTCTYVRYYTDKTLRSENYYILPYAGNNSYVSYPEVLQYRFDQDEELSPIGYTKFVYYPHQPTFGIGLPAITYPLEGFLSSITNYDKDNVVVSTTVYTPEFSYEHDYYGFMSTIDKSCAKVVKYPFSSYSVNTIREIQTQYHDGNETVKIEKDYSYNEFNMMTQEKIKRSDGSFQYTNYQYIADIQNASGTELGMQNAHNISQLKSMNIEGENSNKLYEEVYHYFSGSQFTIPEDNSLFKSYNLSTIDTYPTGSSLEYQTILFYDQENNIKEVHEANGVYTSYIWGHNHRRLVAKIVGASKLDIEGVSGFGLGFDLGSGGLSQSQESSLRSELLNAQVTIYRHDIIDGVTEMIDPNGQITYYEYDASGRLVRIRDDNQDITKTFEYNFKN